MGHTLKALVAMTCVVATMAQANELGLVTGGFYTQYSQPLNGYAEQSLSEFSLLNARWVRLHLNFNGTTPDYVYRRYIELAHARGLKVVALLDAQYTGNDDDPVARDNFIARFIGDGTVPAAPNSLHHFATEVFGMSASSRPDAYEIINEPNNCVSGCDASGANGFFVGGRTFAWLLRRVQEWKQRHGRPELIISGGVLNTYFASETAWWNRFLNESSAWAAGPRPFDYFGVHPYNPYAVDTTNCINRGYGGCFGTWQSQTLDMMSRLASRLSGLPNVGTGWRYFVTELGWQLSDSGSCPSAQNCVATTSQLDEAMRVTHATMNSANVHATLWYDYRDDPAPYPGRFGLRGAWNGSRYPAKQLWHTFRSLSGLGWADPEQTWYSRFSDSVSPFESYVEDLSRRGAIEGAWNGSSWVFNSNSIANRATLVRWMMRAKQWSFDIRGAPHFLDVPTSHPDFNYIETGINKGIISGYSDGNFRPDNEVTRGQTSKIICIAQGYPLLNPATPTFNDVPPGSTFYQFVETLSARGIASGYNCGGVNEPCPGLYFRPGNSVTRGQLTKFISNALATP
ncbi:S-layer homology domain-containing protein [Archangium sp.]|uniref:S-layer homology domain-containing protein n=1 Tax=Archangium sp. TaxID=1872627 RepID=UPI002D509E14|nr:S-layer homology domain-containing protein [Archangium sp.]HYO51955.1 S-layer homology domain-containing protein [Archangium sp.]